MPILDEKQISGVTAAVSVADPVRGPVSLLRWVYVGRISLATAIAVAALFSTSPLGAGLPPSRADITIVIVLLVAASLFTAFSAYRTHYRRVIPSHAFLYSQYLFDLGLVTAVVHVTGGVTSDFASLYIPVIGVCAVTMPFRSAMLVTFAAATAYFTDSVWGSPVQLSLAVWLQIGVFVAVALASGWLASRVRVVGEERQELEQEVQRLRLEASDILREISGGVITVRGDGTLVFANAAAERLLGFSAADWIDDAFLDFLSGRSRELWAAIFATQRDGRRQVRAEGNILLAGRSFPIGVTTTAHYQEGQAIPSITAIFTDISDQKRLNELNLRAERLEAVAALSASLAHEIKNPLASIRSSVEQLGNSVRANEDDRFLSELIIRESDRLSRLLTEFLDFSRVRMTEPQSIDLVRIVSGAVALVREHPDCPDAANIEMHGSRIEIDGDEDLIHRIVMNLVLNAVQASDKQVHVVVTVKQIVATDLPVGVSSDMSALIQVSDNGPGVPEELRKRLFEPFVTGREGGTGLGLAIVQRAVEAHHGLVFVDPGPEEGTIFSIYLPAKGRTEVAA
jgi:two-component system sensor histidine kinase PilS (NtrC family)